MKSLIKYAVGTAIAGALVNVLMKQRSRHSDVNTQPGTQAKSVGQDPASGTGPFSGEQRGPQPDEWRGAQNVLGS